MAITFGKDAPVAPPFGTNIISATYSEEQELIDVTNRDNVGGSVGEAGYKAYMTGYTNKTWEIECHDPTGLLAALEAAPTPGQWTVMSVNENLSVDGVVTFTVTAKEA